MMQTDVCAESTTEVAHLVPILLERCGTVADRWYETLSAADGVMRDVATARAELRTLTRRAIAILVSEPFDAAPAASIGARLVELRYTDPTALGATLGALGLHLVADVRPAHLCALHPRLIAVLGAITDGFHCQCRAAHLDERDERRRTLTAARAGDSGRRGNNMVHAAMHDLRAPATLIIGHADLLRLRLERETAPPADWLYGQVAAIGKGAARIQALVDELLEAACREAGQQLAWHPEPVDVGALAREAAQPWAMGVRGAALIRVDAPEGVLVAGHRGRLERVLDNLLDNAIKYSPGNAPVQLVVRERGDSVTISVRDCGVGIPDNEIPCLFTPFFRASTAHGTAGSGIGLAGAKQIVEQHGGRITVESVVGQGTAVTIVLPRMEANAADRIP